MRFLLLFTFITIYNCQSFAQTADLRLQITHLKVIEKSMVRIAVYNSEESYFDENKIFVSAELPVDSSTIDHTFTSLPTGVYAVTIYHDEDNDGEMDRKWFGPPKEGYAFSNNFRSAFKPASFDDASFTLDGDKELEIQMVY